MQKLIEKDWLHFGHKFTDRCGLLATSDSREMSPIFTQFLDCLRHLLHLLPGEFEYNARLLLELHDQSRASVFGTFVGCCEKDREDLRYDFRGVLYGTSSMIRSEHESFQNAIGRD